MTKVAEIRDNPAAGGGYVCTSATGLVILGRIGYHIFRLHSADWKTYADRLGAIQWEKNAPIWKGNIVVPMLVKRKGQPEQPGLRILQVANQIARAADLVSTQIGLPAAHTQLPLDTGVATAQVSITDGQHRGEAIRRLIDTGVAADGHE